MEQVIMYTLTAGSLYFLTFLAVVSPGRVNVKANHWLALFLFSFAGTVLDWVLYDLDWYKSHERWQGALEVTRFAMAPALYFSVIYFTSPDRKYKKSDLLHFVPFFLYFLFLTSVVTRLNESSAFDWYRSLPAGLRKGFALAVFSSIMIQMVVYWVLAYRRLVLHRKNIKLFASTLEPISLDWLKYFLLGLVVMLLLSVNEVLVLLPALVPFTSVGYLGLTFYIGYYSIRQKEIFPYSKEAVNELKEIMEVEDEKSHSESRMDNELLKSRMQVVLNLMQHEKVFLEPDLGLPQLAAKAELSTHDLSYVLNEGFRENFFQFINRYRVEEAKVLLRSEKHRHLNVLGVAYESGFRSKTTFNTTFKKLTGTSPSAFQKSATSPEKRL